MRADVGPYSMYQLPGPPVVESTLPFSVALVSVITSRPGERRPHSSTPPPPRQSPTGRARSASCELQTVRAEPAGSIAGVLRGLPGPPTPIKGPKGWGGAHKSRAAVWLSRRVRPPCGGLMILTKRQICSHLARVGCVSKLRSSEAAKAVGHPLRARILEALAGEPRSPNELAVEFGEPLGNVSYHVLVLRDLGIIELVETAPRRGAVEHYYRARWRVRLEIEPLDSKPGPALSSQRPLATEGAPGCAARGPLARASW